MANQQSTSEHGNLMTEHETEIVLRKPDLADAANLARLGAETFADTFQGQYSEADLNAYLEKVHSEEAIRHELNDNGLEYRVLEEDGQLIGYVKIGRLSVPVESPAPDAIELRQLYLRKSHIGRGLGKRMMQWAEERFASGGHSEIYVSVFSENSRAIEFYKRGGFEPFGEYGYEVGDHIDREFIFRRIQNCATQSEK